MSVRVLLCPMCEGHPADRFGPGGDCWNCYRSARVGHNPHDPGPGFILRGDPLTAFTPGAVVMDVYRHERWQVLRHGQNWTEARRESDGHILRDYHRAPRFLTPEEYDDPATWAPPERPQLVRPTNHTRAARFAGSRPAQRVPAAKPAAIHPQQGVLL